jgi:CRISPR/Cas system CSM-associated protein Csm3 (group 7 of RAMP superfamily)
MNGYWPYRLEVRGTLELKTPMHIGTGARLDVRTDAPVLRFGIDQDSGHPYVSGSSLRGVIRHRLWRELSQLPASVASFRSLFGETKGAAQEGADGERKGRLAIMDALPRTASTQTQIQDHVRHHPEWGAADDGGKFDREVALSGTYDLALIYSGEGSDDAELALVYAALELLTDGYIRVGANQGHWTGEIHLGATRYWGLDRRKPADLVRFLKFRMEGSKSDAWPGVTERPEPSPKAEDLPAAWPEPESLLTVHLRVQFKGLVLVKAAFNENASAVSLDDVQQEGANWGELGGRLSDSVFVTRGGGAAYLPAQSLRGAILSGAAYSIRSIRDPNLKDRLLQQLSTLQGSVRNHQEGTGGAGMLEIEDATITKGTGRAGYYNRNAIDRLTSTVSGEKLFDEAPLESPAFEFRMAVRFSNHQRDHLFLFYCLLRDLREGLDQVGSGGTTGHGVIQSVTPVKLAFDLADDIKLEEEGDTNCLPGVKLAFDLADDIEPPTAKLWTIDQWRRRRRGKREEDASHDELRKLIETLLKEPRKECPTEGGVGNE